MTDTTTAPGTDLEVADTPPPAITPAGMPTPAEFAHIQQMAAVLAESAYRRKPANVILASLAGRPFGWDPTMSMRSFHVIEGVPSMKPEIMLALIRRAGHSVTGETSSTGATVTGRRHDTGDEMTFTFDQAAAHSAGLLNKAVWKQYAPSMYWARALAQLARMLFPDVVLGAGYTPEELGARISDDDVIDLTDVDGVHIADTPPAHVTETAAKNRLVHVLGDVDEARECWKLRPANLRPGGAGYIDPADDHPAMLDTEHVEAWLAGLHSDDVDVVDAELVEEAHT
jgi:hypothetical protein